MDAVSFLRVRLFSVGDVGGAAARGPLSGGALLGESVAGRDAGVAAAAKSECAEPDALGVSAVAGGGGGWGRGSGAGAAGSDLWG